MKEDLTYIAERIEACALQIATVGNVSMAWDTMKPTDRLMRLAEDLVRLAYKQ